MTAPDPELLPPDAPDPDAHDVTPGWIGRNREAFQRVSTLGRAAIVFTPPPVRIALAGATVALDIAVLTSDMRRRNKETTQGALEAGALVLEAATVVAMSRFAPARLAANLVGIETMRRALRKAAT